MSLHAGHWELDSASADFMEPGSKKAEPIDGLEPVYPQRLSSRITSALPMYTRPPCCRSAMAYFMFHADAVPVVVCRTPLKAKAIPKLVAKALSAVEALPGADDMDILPEQISAQHSLMPWRQVQTSHLVKQHACQESHEAVGCVSESSTTHHESVDTAAAVGCLQSAQVWMVHENV